MRRFYQPVDLRSRQEMTQYLTTHFRYPTLNSWNRSTSYACNLKITHLGLSPEVVDKLFDMIQTQEFFDAMDECKWEFAAKHNYLWQAGMNGRSGGYLVLYQGEKRPSGYKSYCTNCGQGITSLLQMATAPAVSAEDPLGSISRRPTCRW